MQSWWDWAVGAAEEERGSTRGLTAGGPPRTNGSAGPRALGSGGSTSAANVRDVELSRGDVCIRSDFVALPRDVQELAARGGGFAHNMKLVIRGAPRTGKTTLFQRLQGKAPPPGSPYTPSTGIQATTIRWASTGSHLLGAGAVDRNRVELTKIEAWDVVDRGVATVPGRTSNAKLRGAPTLPNMPVDATTVDVYANCGCVVFMLDVTRQDSLDYVRSALGAVPPTVCVVIMASFMDAVQGASPAKRRVVSDGALDRLAKGDLRGVMDADDDGSAGMSGRRGARARFGEAGVACTPFMRSLAEGLPTAALSVPPVVIHASMANGTGLRALHRYLDVPVSLVHAAALEVRLAAVYGAAREGLESVRKIDVETERQASATAAPPTKPRPTSRTRREQPGPSLRLSHRRHDGSASASSSAPSDADDVDEGPHFFGETATPPPPVVPDAAPVAVSQAYLEAAAANEAGGVSGVPTYQAVPDADRSPKDAFSTAGDTGPPGLRTRPSNVSLTSHDDALERLDRAVADGVPRTGSEAALSNFFGPADDDAGDSAVPADDADAAVEQTADEEPAAAVGTHRQNVRAPARPARGKY